MKTTYLFISVLYIFFPSIFSLDPSPQDEVAEVKGKAYIEKLNKLTAKELNKVLLYNWEYATNLTEHNKNLKINASLEYAKLVKKYWLKTVKFSWKSFHDPDLKRQFKGFSILGRAALPDDKQKKLEAVITQMQSIFSKAKVCEYKNPKNCTLSLEPELTEIFSKSRNPEELKYYWVEWRKASGKKCRSLYKDYVELVNEAAKLNNFVNNADFWLGHFESKEFEDDVQELWNEVEPLYMELHAYIRYRLRQKYGDEVVPKKGAIPAHLLGHMWALRGTIYDITAPFPEKQSLDITNNMKKLNYTPYQMYKVAEEFYTSLNLSAMPDVFWEKSVLEKPTDRDVICHGSAWNFIEGEDVRILMCTTVTMVDFINVHHEMGHIEYFLQYKDQPYIYKTSANSGFHEALGDTIALSVATPNHLRKIGLLDSDQPDDLQSDLNFLFLSSLEYVAFLPFGYLTDVWRWGVFRGEITPKNYNCEWWNLRWRFQGIEPPNQRSEEDFDPAGLYHIVFDASYIRYFVSSIIQYQFHRALCEKAGEFDPKNPSAKPLHQCDIYQSVEAGNALRNMLRMGSSKPWPEAMEALTGQRKMDASAILQYYAPLYEWLKEENKRNGEEVGWKNHPLHKSCVESLSEKLTADENHKTTPTVSS